MKRYNNPLEPNLIKVGCGQKQFRDTKPRDKRENAKWLGDRSPQGILSPCPHVKGVRPLFDRTNKQLGNRID